MNTTAYLLVGLLVAGSVGFLVLGAAGLLTRRERVRRRFSDLAVLGPGPIEGSEAGQTHAIDPDRLGLNAAARRHMRMELIAAGIFDPGAVASYGLVRLALLLGIPLLGLIAALAAPPNFGATETAALIVTCLAIAYYLPRAYLSRRRQRLQADYRLRFPDFLDMMVVCINAGLSLEAALDRAGRELGTEDAAFRANLDLMAGEMRAGKSTAEALRAFAERLGLPEARAFAALLKQTIELGTDVTQALTTFSDEMRTRRMAAAEERAAALPPKLAIPLGLFIFPVVLIAILAPAVLRVLAVTAP